MTRAKDVGRLFLAATVLAMGLALTLPGSTMACMIDPPDCPLCPYFPSTANVSHKTTVEFLSQDHALIIIEEYVTTHIVPGGGCVTGLSPVAGIRSINAIVNFNGVTDEPFDEVSFFSHPNAGYEMAALAAEIGLTPGKGDPWQGFVADITGTVDDGLPNFFVLDVTLEAGVSPADLVGALMDHGYYLTASSDDNGSPDGGHTVFRRLGDYEIVVIPPPAQ